MTIYIGYISLIKVYLTYQVLGHSWCLENISSVLMTLGPGISESARGQGVILWHQKKIRAT